MLDKFRYAEGSEAIQLSLSAADLAGVTIIAESAFSGCSSLFSIMISNSVTSIKSRTFSHCTSLVSIVIPNSVKIIDASSYCTWCVIAGRAGWFLLAVCVFLLYN